VLFEEFRDRVDTDLIHSPTCIAFARDEFHVQSSEIEAEAQVSLPPSSGTLDLSEEPEHFLSKYVERENQEVCVQGGP
jgi:hypothetical protein